MAFSLLDVVADGAEVSSAPTTGSYGARSGKDQLLAAVALEGYVGRMPLVDLAERDFARLVVPFYGLDDLLCHGLLPLPAAQRIQRRLTKDSLIIMFLIRSSLCHHCTVLAARLRTRGRESLPAAVPTLTLSGYRPVGWLLFRIQMFFAVDPHLS